MPEWGTKPANRYLPRRPTAAVGATTPLPSERDRRTPRFGRASIPVAGAMNPAFSVIVFTTVAGAAQGLVVALAFAVLGGVDLGAAFLGNALLVAAAMLVVGLGASFLHLGRPERAWRAAMMWRTSWLSREVIVLPAFIGVVALWWLALRSRRPPR